MINPKRTTQWSVMQQRNVSHSTVGTVASGYAIDSAVTDRGSMGRAAPGKLNVNM